MDYKNEICPVCGEPFKNDDDIVVCPDCGTPYHRECWKKVGYCTFRDRHAEGFVWQPSVKEETPEEQAQINEPQNDGQEQQPIQPVFMKTASEEDFENLLLQGVAADKSDEFDGIKVTEAALYLQTGNRRYINKFMRAERSKAKITWNWAAFFLAPAWFFYRKLYKAGLIFLSVFVALNLFMGGVAQRVYDNYDDLSAQIYKIYNGDNDEEAAAKLTADPEFTEKYEVMSKDVGKLIAVTFLIPNTAAALCADFLLKKKMKKEIKEAKEYTEDSRSEKIELIRRGGVSPFAFLAVFIAQPYLSSVLINIADWIKNWF